MKRFSIAIFTLIILFVLSTIIAVDETEQIVILQFGKPVQTITDPGLNFKFPAPIQVSNSFDKRLLEYDVPPEEILSRDKKSLIIDNYVRWRIVDPLLFLQTVSRQFLQLSAAWMILSILNYGRNWETMIWLRSLLKHVNSL